jgi:hypothetical protein
MQPLASNKMHSPRRKGGLAVHKDLLEVENRNRFNRIAFTRSRMTHWAVPEFAEKEIAMRNRARFELS